MSGDGKKKKKEEREKGKREEMYMYIYVHVWERKNQVFFSFVRCSSMPKTVPIKFFTLLILNRIDDSPR